MASKDSKARKVRKARRERLARLGCKVRKGFKALRESLVHKAPSGCAESLAPQDRRAEQARRETRAQGHRAYEESAAR